MYAAIVGPCATCAQDKHPVCTDHTPDFRREWGGPVSLSTATIVFAVFRSPISSTSIPMTVRWIELNPCDKSAPYTPAKTHSPLMLVSLYLYASQPQISETAFPQPTRSLCLRTYPSIQRYRASEYTGGASSCCARANVARNAAISSLIVASSVSTRAKL